MVHPREVADIVVVWTNPTGSPTHAAAAANNANPSPKSADSYAVTYQRPASTPPQTVKPLAPTRKSQSFYRTILRHRQSPITLLRSV
eukprot:CAMPEP_0198369782 /NCGR_PEP_ID=MMETSP1450-20131203/156384_1 /TAXON_ID=753684 ORGANISM="Madagascaria erythrocladiodes, Strain CCMP3234" /NCGR_SAMPLE_ID=MMETSP1450 /ASSEMBLY_ACC=CAM_ASM_001115 /LENGTH=86 /DNA_ID=CAMNT_0044077309 /DNA_START=1139 /DNA_END=1396 /DNA_ORIENTATION=+